jgi:hypothetical protein
MRRGEAQRATMRILLLHPEDRFPRSGRRGDWDLVIDFGRVPVSTYAQWSREAGCSVVSIWSVAEEITDLHRTRELLQFGMGRIVDEAGIDWWDVMSLMIVPELQQLMLMRRLAERLPPGCELHTSRPGPLATALKVLNGGRLINRENGLSSTFRRARRYVEIVSRLDTAQLSQVLQDKFDTEHRIRRRLERHRVSSRKPVVLLPSAYVNVSRMAVSYARLLPEHDFLLVCARNSGKIKSLPTNVNMASLDPYFTSTNQRVINLMMDGWDNLKKRLIECAEEFKIADVTGVLRRIPALLRWGVATRDAWNQVFETENVIACLCADDSNPYTRIPLILAKKQGIPSLACHHGALDYRMAMKTNYADWYLAKGDMEKDYLLRKCEIAPEKIVVGGPPHKDALAQPIVGAGDKPWLVFFTEPYQASGWRVDEVYREILPRLSLLAKTCGLQLVFKLHPFESEKGHRRWLRRYLPHEESETHVICGPPTAELWQKTRFAMTVQSSVALECTALGIPVFLCAWLRDPFAGYVQQFERFGAGIVLDSPQQISDIPFLLESQTMKSSEGARLWHTIKPEKLRELLSGIYSLRTASTA